MRSVYYPSLLALAERADAAAHALRVVRHLSSFLIASPAGPRSAGTIRASSVGAVSDPNAPGVRVRSEACRASFMLRGTTTGAYTQGESGANRITGRRPI